MDDQNVRGENDPEEESGDSDPSNQGDTKDERVVTHIRVVVHDQGLDPKTGIRKNHWTIFLIISKNDGGGSARVNMRTKEKGKLEGELEFKSNLPYTEPKNEIQHWEFPVLSKGVTFFKIQMHILGKGRHRFKLDKGGSGCRYWVWRVMKDFTEPDAAYIREDAAAELWDILEKRYDRSGSTSDLKMVPGTFASS